MDWKNLLWLVGGMVLAEIVRKAWKDLVPDKTIFTVKGTFIGGAVIAFAMAGWPIVQASRGNDLGAAIATTVLSVMAFSLGISALVAIIGWYQIYLLKGRVTTIEKHVGLPKSGVR